MRIIRLMFVAIISMTLASAITGAVEARRLENKVLLEISGVAKSTQEVPQALISVFESISGKSKEDVKSAVLLLKRLIPKFYSSDKLLAIIDEELSKELTEYEKNQLVDFYSRSSTQRILRAVDSVKDNTGANLLQYLKKNREPPSGRRVSLYQDIIKTRGLLEDGLSILRITYVAIPGVVMKAIKMPENMGEGAEQFSVAEKRLKQTFNQFIFLIYVDALKRIPEQDLESYLEFIQSAVGQRYISLQRKLMAEAMMIQADELAQEIAQQYGTSNAPKNRSDNRRKNEPGVRDTQQKARRLNNRELLEKSNSIEFAQSFPALVIQGFNSAQTSNITIEKRLMRLVNQLVPVAYKPEKVLAIIDGALDEELTQGQKKQLLDFYTSDLGRRLSQTGKATMRTMVNNPAKIIGYIKRHNVDPYRDGLYRDIIEAAGELENAISMNRIMNVAIPVAVMTALKRPVNPDDVQKSYLRQQKQLMPQIHQNILAAYIYAYRNMSNEELEAYLTFTKTPIGQRYSSLNRKLWAEALMIQTDEFAQMLVDELGIDPQQLPGASLRSSP